MVETVCAPQDQCTPISAPSWLIVPTILPEELADGYIARLRIVNDFRSTKDLFNALKETAPELEFVPKVQVLALLSGIPLKEFVCRHTLTPFKRAFGLVGQRFHAHGEDIGGHLKYGTMWLPTGKVSACPECVEEDIDYWGFSYWRRIHQAPGIGWCPKHQTKLVNGEKFALNAFPDQIIALKSGASGYDKSGPSEIVKRYADIVDLVLDRKSPVNVRVLQQAVRNEASKFGMRISAQGRRPLLSDLALQECPYEWLVQLIPEFKKKETGQSLTALDDAARYGGAGPSQEASMLALALIFPSSEAAFHKINDVLLAEPKMPKRVDTKFTRDFWLGAEFTKIYLKQQGNLSRISKDLGVSYSHTRSCLQKVGLPVFSDKKLQLIKPAMKDFLNGDDLGTVCDRYKIESHLIEQVMRLDLFRAKQIFII